MTYSSKEFRKRNYFTLYDENDNLICYFNNYDELKKTYKRALRNIVIEFKKTKDFIKITINQKEYKLYTFCD